MYWIPATYISRNLFPAIYFREWAVTWNNKGLDNKRDLAQRRIPIQDLLQRVRELTFQLS